MEVRELDVITARELLEQGQADLIDIRDGGEREQLRIPESRWMPLTGLAAGLKGDPDKGIGIFHCQSGRRTHNNKGQLAGVGYAETYVLNGGIKAWKEAGYPTESEKHAIPIMRQVQIVAGSLVVLGVLLGIWVNPWFYTLSGFVGAGLMYSGISGWCGMAMMLGRLPFNR